MEEEEIRSCIPIRFFLLNTSNPTQKRILSSAEVNTLKDIAAVSNNPCSDVIDKLLFPIKVSVASVTPTKLPLSYAGKFVL